MSYSEILDQCSATSQDLSRRSEDLGRSPTPHRAEVNCGYTGPPRGGWSVKMLQDLSNLEHIEFGGEFPVVMQRLCHEAVQRELVIPFEPWL